MNQRTDTETKLGAASCKVVHTPADVVSRVTKDMVTQMRIGVESIEHLDAVFIAIEDCTHRDSRTAMHRLAQIRKLARLGKLVAADRGNLLDIACDEIESESLTVLLAAVEGRVK